MSGQHDYARVRGGDDGRENGARGDDGRENGACGNDGRDGRGNGARENGCQRGCVQKAIA